MRIGVAMSGGMDSTAAALILKKQGHNVIGLHIKLHGLSEVTWGHAQRAADEIDVPIHLVDLSAEFKTSVINPFVKAYSKGLTPSPCLVCNRIIKMTFLFEQARSLGCTQLATGHYARSLRGSGASSLMKGVDPVKDQSYFLSMLTSDILQRTIFPLGEWTKEDTRCFIRQEGISVWQSDESQELCFIPDNNYREFLLREGVEPRPGPIVDCTGRRIGKHYGITGYTVGQRRGLGISAEKPLYVIRIEADRNTIVVGTKDQTLVSTLRIKNFNLLRPLQLVPGEKFHIKVRSTSKPVVCTVQEFTGDLVVLTFRNPHSGVAPGQAAVLYTDDHVVGGGWISE